MADYQRKGKERRKNLRIRTRAWVRAEYGGELTITNDADYGSTIRLDLPRLTPTPSGRSA